MAGIDKIYGTRAQYWELKKWLEEEQPFYPWRIAQEDNYDDNTQVLNISNFSEVEDFYLWHFCPIGWVHTRLKEQYGSDGPGP